MKRAVKKKSKAAIENSSGEDAPVGDLNKTVNALNINSSWMSGKAAIIALAISMGATSLLVTRQSDQALAAKSVDSQKADTPTAVPVAKVSFTNTKLLESEAASSVSVPINPAIVEPTAILQMSGLGAKSQATVLKDTILNAVSVIRLDYFSTGLQKGKSTNVLQQRKNPYKKLVFGNPNSPRTSGQLKAQQEFALNRLQENAKRLKTALAVLHSEKAKAVLTNSLNSVKSNNRANLIDRLRKAKWANAAESFIATATYDKQAVSDTINIVVYEVKSGDTLAAIAEEFSISVSEIVRINQLTNPYQLKISEKLNIPISGSTSRVDNVENNKVVQAKRNSIAVETGVPTAMLAIRVANISINPDKNVKTSPSLNSLRKEIEKLRAKYRAQRSGQQLRSEGNSQEAAVESTISSINNIEVPIFLPRPITSGDGSPRSTRPRFSPSRFRNNGVRQSRSPSSPESLEKLRAVKVSPKTKILPPLAAVDKYLPRPIGEIPKSSSTYVWPAKGTLTSGYGWRWGRMHRGIDIANSTGTPIYAAADGIVTSAGWNRGGYGKLVEISHNNGIVTRYAHNSKIFVKVGQQVKQGKTIALMGSTGFSTGPHSHFEIRPIGKGAVNPIAYLPPRL